MNERAPTRPGRRSSGLRDLAKILAGVAALFGVGTAVDAYDRVGRGLQGSPYLGEALVLAAFTVAGIAVFALRRWRQAEEEHVLREVAESRFREIVERVPAVVYVWDGADAPGTAPASYISPQIERLLGYLPTDWLAAPDAWSSLVHPEDLPRTLQAWDEAATAGGRFSQEYRIRRADGSWVWVRDDASPVGIGARGAPIYQGVLIDVTEQLTSREQLLAAEERYRSLVEQLPVVVYTDAVDEQSTALYISPGYKDLTGYTAEQRLADPGLWVRMLHPEDRDAVLEESERTNRTGEPFDVEYRVVTADGRTVWLHDRAVLVSRRGESAVWQGVLTDVTDRRRAEEALERRDRLLQSAAFAAERFLRETDPLAALGEVLERLGVAGDATRAYVWTNEGDSDDELTTSLVSTWHSPGSTWSSEDPRLVERFPWKAGGLARWMRLLGEGRPVHGRVADFPARERELLGAEPSPIRSLVCQPIVVDGHWWGYLGLDRCDHDETWSDAEVEALSVAANTLGAAIARRGATTQLREAEERFRGIVEHVAAGIYVDRADESLQTIYVSPQIEELTGISPQEWIDDPDAWADAIDPEDREAVLDGYLDAINRGEPWSAEYRIRTRDGRTIWVHDETTFLHDEQGQPSFIQGVIFDVTERKLAEEALRESERRERDAAERLRALDEMKNTFLAAVSHELRSPLTSILGLALTLERTPDLDPAERLDLLRRLAGNATKLDRLLKDLLDIDRLQRGIVEPQYRPTDVSELGRRIVEQLEVLEGRDVVIDAEPIVVPIDPAKVERIVENLLTNAARHTASDVRIWLSIRRSDEGVLIAVEDDGPGVADELKSAIFEPFRQGPTASPHAPGTGVGLSLVARFSELHGGRAWVEDRPGGGASFRVSLPAPTTPDEGYGDRSPEPAEAH